ncbi:MAG: adenylate kinase [Victivallales bacterium]|nr:adenylate kinase [Victivallales bacterium]
MLAKKNLVFLGAPGAGKGTAANALTEREPLVHISTGDILRSEIKNGTELGRNAAVIMKKGELVPDEIVAGMVKSRLQEADCDNGFILDGFPRTLRQAELLASALKEIGRSLDAVVYFAVSDDILLKRLTARISCRQCGRIYNRIFLPPEKDNICDDCGGELIQRPDDSPAIAKERLRVFYENTRPLIAYYRTGNLLETITETDKDKMLAALFAALN